MPPTVYSILTNVHGTHPLTHTHHFTFDLDLQIQHSVRSILINKHNFATPNKTTATLLQSISVQIPLFHPHLCCLAKRLHRAESMFCCRPDCHVVCLACLPITLSPLNYGSCLLEVSYAPVWVTDGRRTCTQAIQSGTHIYNNSVIVRKTN